MTTFFKKKINLIHTFRDYESEFSSKNDVFVPHSENQSRFRRIKTLYGKILDKLTDNTKGNSKTNLSRRTDAFPDNENFADDPTHTPAHAIFNYHQKRFMFCKESLTGLGQDSQFRKFAVWITESIYFEFFTIILIVFNSIMLGLKDYRDGYSNEVDDIYKYIEPIVLGYNLVEAFLKSVARGFNVDQNSYIRSNMNIIDFFIAISGFSYVIDDVLRYFSILRLPRVVIFLEKFDFFKTIGDMTSLILDSILPLFSVFLMLIFFYSIFAILGLHIYVGSLSSRCKTTLLPENGLWINSNLTSRLCGEGFDCPAGTYCGSNYDYPSLITGDLGADLHYSQFNFGLTDFDNFPDALFSVFIINHGSWSNLLINLADSKTMILAVIYCTVNYLVCNIFVFQIAVAVMLDNYEKKTKSKKPNIATQLERTERADEKANELMKKFTMFQKNFWKRVKQYFRVYFPSVKVPEEKYYRNPLARITYKIVNHNLFRYSTGLLTISNLIALCFDGTYLDEQKFNVIKTMNNICVYIFFVEVILRILSISFYKYIEETFNIFEFLIAIGSVIEISQTNDISVLSVLRGFKLLRHLKDEYEWNSFRVLAIVVFDGLAQAVGFITILGLYMYCFAIIGMKFFAGTFIFNEQGIRAATGIIPRANFDSLKEAYTTVFQVLVGENFNEVIFNAILAVGWSSIIYFVFLVITGKFLLLQMFLAVILGNFEDARGKVSFKQSVSKAFISRILRKKKIKRYSKMEIKKNFLEKKSGITPMAKLGGLMLRHQLTLKEAATQGYFDEKIKSRSKSITDEALNNYTKHLIDEVRHYTPRHSEDKNHNNSHNRDKTENELDFEADEHEIEHDHDEHEDEDHENEHEHEHEKDEIDEFDEASMREKNPEAKIQIVDQQEKSDLDKDIEDSDYQRQNSGGPDAHVQMTLRTAMEKANTIKTLHPAHGKSFVLAKSSRVFPEGGLHSSESLNSKHNQNNDFSLKQFIKNRKESSVFIFFRNSKFRLYILNIIENELWDQCMIGAIFLNAILLILDSPLNDPDSLSSGVYRILGAALTALFTVELAFKIIAYGFLFNYEHNKRAYIRDYWNVLDCAVVIISLIDLASGIGSGVQGLKSLRALRALRPLRVIRKYHGLRLIVNALFKTIQALKNFLVVSGLLVGICALVAVELFKGSFYFCVKDGVRVETIDNRSQCDSSQGMRWSDAYSNFDDIGASLLLFLQMVAGGGYSQALYSAVDSRGEDLQPQSWARPGLLIYFYLFMIAANILILNTFIGFSIENFREIKEELVGLKELNGMQREWVEMQTSIQRKSLRTIIPEPTNKFRAICFVIMNQPIFEQIMVIVIILNMFFLCLRYAHQASGLEFAIELINYIFLGFFHIEFIIKAAASGSYYFKNVWNKLDIFILIVTDIFLILKVMDYLDLATIPTVFRMMRLGKIVKYVRRSKSVQILIDTIYSVLPSLGNIVFLMLLLMFIYGILGMNLFAQIKYQTYINETANFRSLISALSILAKTAVGQDWSYIMLEISNPNIAGCIDSQSYREIQDNGILGCGTLLGYPYFLSYIFLVTLILIYLFLAIVTGGYADSKKENDAVISPNHWDEFIDKWAEYDPLGTGFITPEQLAFLVHDLPPPIGVKDDSSIKFEFDLQSKKVKGWLVSENKRIVIKRKQLYEDMVHYDVPVYAAKLQELAHGHVPIFHTKIHISDVSKVVCYNAIFKRYNNKDALEIRSDHVLRTLAKGWIDKFSVLKRFYKDKPGQGDIPLLSVSEFFAGTSIALQWKKFREEKRLLELQRLEKGLEYEGFQYQQRLANLAPKRLVSSMNQPVRRDVKRGSTIIKDNRKSQEIEPESKKNLDEMKPESGDHDMSISSLRKRKRADTQLEHLKKYRERNVNDDQRMDTQDTADDDYWLVPVPERMRYPAAVNKEVDRYFLEALEGRPDDATPVITRRDSHAGRRNSEIFPARQTAVSRKGSLAIRRSTSTYSAKHVEEMNQSLEFSKLDSVPALSKHVSRFNEDPKKNEEEDLSPVLDFRPVARHAIQEHQDFEISSIDSSSSSDSSDTQKQKSGQKELNSHDFEPISQTERAEIESPSEKPDALYTLESERQILATETDQLEP